MTENTVYDTTSNLAISFPPVFGERVEHLYPNIRVTIERITPEVAERMLTTNIKNRKIKSKPLNAVKSAINNNEWSLNGEAIVFDKFGKLSDGQHRLMACVKTGKSIDVVVVRGVEEEAQDTIDNGTSRQLADYIRIDGYKNYTDVAAVGKALIRKDDLGICPVLFDNGNTSHSLKAMRRYIHNCHDERIEPLIPHIRAVRTRFPHMNVPVLGALFDEFRKAGDEDFTEFVAQLTGKSEACIPVRLLRQKLVDHAKGEGTGKGKYKKSYIAAYFIKTWNAYMRGDGMVRLTYSPGGKNPEKFPEVFLSYE